eukprot:CAMPEP_0172533002 /NCGR_PEP_ID=MMETSP1067-20121228/5851_1 /TAXON_ID=265564 ORGANISM="Thalassiosira punctigera, Strain Tpunct2005C2" /NCGR_SAMPLE_ID=MMETSP1067 /ASSEMBLY_ACC=CAM_ASM_000444 /LENGTH=503 /DNA_ID=CAMNT_0013317585 /DNA_START=48 /DNA_END=1556 /DNA_ORIENTATION=+
MVSSELALLRSALQDLQSYELPTAYHLDLKEKDPRNNGDDTNADDDVADNKSGVGDANNKSENESPPAAPLTFYDPQLLRRYKSARDSYVRQRTFEIFLTSLGRYDQETGSIPLPDAPPADEGEELRRRQAEVLGRIDGTMEDATAEMEVVRVRWEQFVEKREELAQIVQGMERGERNLRLEGDGSGDREERDKEEGGDDDDDEVTDTDVALQEEKLDELRQRKLELDERLRSVRAEILDIEDDNRRTKRVVNEARVRGGRKPLDWPGATGLNGEDSAADGEVDEGGDKSVEYTSVVARGVDMEIAEMEEKASELKQSCEIYNDMRELVEELGGVKILSYKSIPASSSAPSSDGDAAVSKGDGRESPGKWRKLDKEEGFIVTLMLYRSHVLEITLSASPGDKDSLCVSSAELTTPTAISVPEMITTDTVEGEDNNHNMTMSLAAETMHSISLSNSSLSRIMSRETSSEVTVPPLDDLVTWSQSFDSSSCGMRFVVAEAAARLR